MLLAEEGHGLPTIHSFRELVEAGQFPDAAQVGRDGLSALDLVQAARSYGLRVRAVSLQEDDLSLITCPAIIHWEFNHFMIKCLGSHLYLGCWIN